MQEKSREGLLVWQVSSRMCAVLVEAMNYNGTLIYVLLFLLIQPFEIQYKLRILIDRE